jgi:hypothetical protein
MPILIPVSSALVVSKLAKPDHRVGFCPTCEAVLIGVHKIGRFRLRYFHRGGTCTEWFWTTRQRDATYLKVTPKHWTTDPDF